MCFYTNWLQICAVRFSHCQQLIFWLVLLFRTVSSQVSRIVFFYTVGGQASRIVRFCTVRTVMNQKVLFYTFVACRIRIVRLFCTASWCHYLVFFIYTNSVQDGASEKWFLRLRKEKNTMWYIKIYFYYSTRTIIYIEITKC